MLLLNEGGYSRVFSFLTKQREMTPALQGCEQSVWLSLTYFFPPPSLMSPIFFPPLLPPPLLLSVCHFLLSLSGPQNKDSRESLPYDGEEKEVRERPWCVTHSLSICHVIKMCVYVYLEREGSTVCARKITCNWKQGFVCLFCHRVHLGDPSSTCAVHVWYREHADVGTLAALWVLISFVRANKVTFYHSS